ncbi:hypothetical protein ABEP44_12830, partial [Cutibacterium acnes]
LFAGLIKSSICIYVASIGFARIFKIKNHKSIVAPITLLMMHLACFIYENTMEMFEWASQVYQYHAIPFQVIIPILTLIIAEIRFRISKKKKLA